MSEHRESSAEEALILITLACCSADFVRAFMRRAKIRPQRGASVSDAILAHYRTRRGYDLRRFATDFRGCASTVLERAA
jgi:hypothetical protein